jgi:hypothetical protein
VIDPIDASSHCDTAHDALVAHQGYEMQPDKLYNSHDHMQNDHAINEAAILVHYDTMHHVFHPDHTTCTENDAELNDATKHRCRKI